MNQAKNIQGWMNGKELQWLSEQAGKHDLIVEVGTWKGRSAACLAQHAIGKLYCVDHFHGNPGNRDDKHLQAVLDREGLIAECRYNLKEWLDSGTVELMIMSSQEACVVLAGFNVRPDMIFIDADHEYRSVKQDIELWLSLLRAGGILCGHDINQRSVLKAVDELLQNWTTHCDDIWCYKKE